MKKKLILLGLTSLIILTLDQLTKGYIIKAFQYGQSEDVIKNFFNITYVRNYGAAFGILSNVKAEMRDMFFLLMPPLAMTVILVMLKMTPNHDKIRKLSLCSVFAGALGNYIDRLRFGYVVDFLDFHYYGKWAWPAFNVADMAIVCGVTVLCILEFLPSEQKSTQ